MEPTDLSQRPPQLPAVMMSHDVVTIFSSAPRRLAISLPPSTSKPSISFLSLRKDCGGYSASADMVSVLVLLTRSSFPPSHQTYTPRADPPSATQPNFTNNTFV